MFQSYELYLRSHCIILTMSSSSDRFFTKLMLVGENVSSTIKRKIKTTKIKSKIEAC